MRSVLVVLLLAAALMVAATPVRADSDAIDTAAAADAEEVADFDAFVEVDAAEVDEAEDEEADEAEEEESESEESESDSEDESEEETEEEEAEEVAELEVTADADADATASCLANFNAATFASTARALQQSWAKQGIKYSQTGRSFGAKPSTGKSDCSGFVTSVLESKGWNCVSPSARNTAEIDAFIRKNGGYSQTPKVGDIVMWSGHTAICGPKACPAGSCSIVYMGGSGPKESSQCLTPTNLKGKKPKWGIGSWYGFWTPGPRK